MVLIESYPLAVFLCIITMICWGSWANALKLSPPGWSFQLFYWDYSIGVLLLTLVLGLTLGSMGEQGRSFIADLQQADSSALGMAFLGGVIFNLANLLVVVAIDIAGMAVAFPIAIGLALVIGVAVNYLATPVGDPFWLFMGVALVVIAIILDALAYSRISKGTSRLAQGIIISILGGILMGYFYRFVAASMATDTINPEAGLLTNYGAVFIFSVGIFISNFLWNTILMYKPISGEPVTYRDYFKRANLKTHGIGWLGGIVWSLGMSFSLMASATAGYAIAYGLGQGATMIGAAWGVFVWKEFKSAPPGTNRMLTAMFVTFIAGLLLIIYSRYA